MTAVVHANPATMGAIVIKDVLLTVLITRVMLLTDHARVLRDILVNIVNKSAKMLVKIASMISSARCVLLVNTGWLVP